ncbi:MAG: hypothetical protein LBU27_01670 [Candidatus Peribacteria bacterium]|jgi:hypothetical protein|nr:hypothetical protein [Candidatus Peribacteria bacterium]
MESKKHLSLTETLHQLSTFPSLVETKALLVEILDDETYTKGLRAFFGIKGMRNPYLYEACKRSGLMMEYGEAAVQRLVIKEFLALSPAEIEHFMPSNALVCELAKMVQTKYGKVL